MNGWMQGQVAVVTGGGSGIGRGVVDAFVREGAKVGVLEIDPLKADDLKAVHGELVHVLCGDATTLEANKVLVEETSSKYGKIDTLVCVAGIWDFSVSVLDLPEDRLGAAFDELFAVNVKSILFAVKASAPELIRNSGSIVLTASNSAFYPSGGGALYTASKFAVRGLVSQLAFEFAPKVRVNGVAPGGTVTPLRGVAALDSGEARLADIPHLSTMIARDNPLQMTPEAADHAWAYVYLAAAGKSRAVTGTIIHSDGGIGVRGINKMAGLLPGL